MAMRTKQFAVVDILRAAGAITSAEQYRKLRASVSSSDSNSRSAGSSIELILDDDTNAAAAEDSEGEGDGDDSHEQNIGHGSNVLFSTHYVEVEVSSGSDTDSSESDDSGTPSLSEESDPDEENIDYVDGLGMALLRLEQVSIFPAGTKRSLASFLMREIKTVIGDLSKLFPRYETPRVTDAAVERWNEIITDMAARPAIKAILGHE
ncbi:hypothetical protein Micbo1qcDRAFT_166405 [Microdochium bolleyi]|uniref:Uncharacterized protein n=1 Tax=Microdochium bolleyi TaxID=196109 RepID=A0A136ITR5_9PEZI|nr:hypothetical protein Micbo1qcDRAFT_166405 [Microdochium bolleyi]